MRPGRFRFMVQRMRPGFKPPQMISRPWTQGHGFLCSNPNIIQSPVNPYDVIWPAGIVLVGLLIAFLILGPFLSGLLLVLLVIVVTGNLITR